jgi:hypothetical protein
MYQGSDLCARLDRQRSCHLRGLERPAAKMKEKNVVASFEVETPECGRGPIIYDILYVHCAAM